MKKTKLFLLLSLMITVILFFILGYFIVKPNHDETIPKYEAFTGTPINDTFDFKSVLSPTAAGSIRTTFPYEKYIQSARYLDIHAIKNDLSALDAIYPSNKSNGANIEALYYSMADSLLPKKQQLFQEYNSDTLIRLLQWAEGMKYIALYEPDHALLYNSVGDFWINFISQQLSAQSEKNSKAKYDFKYRFLKGKLLELSYTFSTKVGSFNKFVYNIASNNWAHLFDATWNQTSVLQKLIFIILGLGTIFCYVVTIAHFLSKFKSSKNIPKEK